jgi:hypothetical protein
MTLATAIAAGNRAIIKPSEFTPATSHLLARMLAQIFTQEQVAVMTGDAEPERAGLKPASPAIAGRRGPHQAGCFAARGHPMRICRLLMR